MISDFLHNFVTEHLAFFSGNSLFSYVNTALKRCVIAMYQSFRCIMKQHSKHIQLMLIKLTLDRARIY